MTRVYTEFKNIESTSENYTGRPASTAKGRGVGRIVPMCFASDDLKAMETAVKARKQFEMATLTRSLGRTSKEKRIADLQNLPGFGGGDAGVGG
jgi:hypothetical protein